MTLIFVVVGVWDWEALYECIYYVHFVDFLNIQNVVLHKEVLMKVFVLLNVLQLF